MYSVVSDFVRFCWCLMSEARIASLCSVLVAPILGLNCVSARARTDRTRVHGWVNMCAHAAKFSASTSLLDKVHVVFANVALKSNANSRQPSQG